MPKYDIENFLNDLQTILVNNLNAAIDVVEAEKVSQGLPATALAHVDTTVGADGRPAGYFKQNWSYANLNVSPAIFFGVEDIKALGRGPATSQQYKVFIEAILTDGNMDVLGNDRVLRYIRALQDVLHANWDRFPGTDRVLIETLIPFSFKIDQGSSETVRVGGVTITTALA